MCHVYLQQFLQVVSKSSIRMMPFSQPKRQKNQYSAIHRNFPPMGPIKNLNLFIPLGPSFDVKIVPLIYMDKTAKMSSFFFYLSCTWVLRN